MTTNGNQVVLQRKQESPTAVGGMPQTHLKPLATAPVVAKPKPVRYRDIVGIDTPRNPLTGLPNTKLTHCSRCGAALQADDFVLPDNKVGLYHPRDDIFTLYARAGSE